MDDLLPSLQELGAGAPGSHYSAIRTARRTSRVLLERGLLFALAVCVALVAAKSLGVGLSLVFASVSNSL